VWQTFPQDEVLVLGIINTSNSSQIETFVTENNITFPILFDSGSSGGVQGGDVYDLYYMPNDGSPYPRDFVVGQDGIIRYANNEIDTEWMLDVIANLVGDGSDGIIGDLNFDEVVNILDVIILVNIIVGLISPDPNQLSISDINSDGIVNILDIVSIINIIIGTG
tara:strand:- start:202 stop:696 length:495 start_codon:yes stop_codon:yes gene_type:complete